MGSKRALCFHPSLSWADAQVLWGCQDPVWLVAKSDFSHMLQPRAFPLAFWLEALQLHWVHLFQLKGETWGPGEHRGGRRRVRKLRYPSSDSNTGTSSERHFSFSSKEVCRQDAHPNRARQGLFTGSSFLRPNHGLARRKRMLSVVLSEHLNRHNGHVPRVSSQSRWDAVLDTWKNCSQAGDTPKSPAGFFSK